MKFFKIKQVSSMLLVLLVASSLLFTGCGAQNKSADSAKSEAAAPSYEYDKVNTEPAASDEKGKASEQKQGSVGFTQSEQVIYQQMMIYTGRLEMEVDDMNSAANTILKIVKDANGYLISSSLKENEGMYYGHFEYRIPVNGFDDVVEAIKKLELGKVSFTDIDGQDITEEFYDLESRLKAKRIYESRLLEFLTKAQKTEDLLIIFNDLNRVQEEIEVMEGRMRYLKNHADFSTLTIDMEQYKNQAAATATTWQKSMDGFKRSIEGLVNMFKSFFVWFISSLPILFLLGIVIGILWRFGLKRILTKYLKRRTTDEHND